jgi:aminopeptidase N
MRTEQAGPVRLENYRPPDWLVETMELDVSLHPTATKVRATLRMSPNPKASAPAPIVLDGDGLTLTSLKLDGSEMPGDSYAATPDSLSIPQPPAGTCYLQIETLVDPSANTQLMGLYRSNGTYCTQCEAEGFRRITYFPDRPDVMAIYTTRIEAERSEAPVLLSNGNLIESGDVPGTARHFAVWHDPFPKPAYLFALVGGDLGCVEDKFVTMSGRDVTLRIYVEHGKEDRCAWAMDSLKRSMRWDEEAFGREYDLDIFMIAAVSDFNMGAMENKGLNVFNDKLVLASPETATDADYASIETVIAHEYFHNWTGNRITCRDWFQLCLKEGLTVFRDQEFSADQRSRSVKRIADVRALRAHQFVEDAGPLAHPVRPSAYSEISNFYTATVYEKGAEVVRMLKVLLGPGGFRKGLDLYFTRHDGEAATVDHFVQCFADANNTDLTQFTRWYAQAGTPEVIATGSYDAAAQTYRLDLTQSIPPTPGQPVKEPMVIPLAVGLVDSDGRDTSLSLEGGRPVVRGIVTLTRATQSFEFTGVPERPVLSINRGFSAPIKLQSNVTPDDLEFLAAHDSDPFNRWQAIQSLANVLLIGNVTEIRASRQPKENAGLSAALTALLADEALEPAFAALALTLPGENDIAREIGRDIDPNAVFLSRSWLRAALSSRLAPALRETYRRLDDGSPFSPDAASAGRRALKNACLDLLAATAAASAIALAARQYHQATNMTDRMAALTTLSLYPVPERQAALDDFYRRYSGNPLVIDKWFALQATIPDPATLDRVKVLMAHPAFSLTNPNRVRALIGAFVQMNPTQFNRADGAGFDFLANTVLALDPKNPQVAARITTAFRSWRALEPIRRVHAETALRRIAAAQNLSRDLRDIVDRSLGTM